MMIFQINRNKLLPLLLQSQKAHIVEAKRKKCFVKNLDEQGRTRNEHTVHKSIL